MKEILVILLTVVGIACAWAQNPTMPADSHATAVQQGQAVDLNGNTTIDQIDSAEQAQPQAIQQPASATRVVSVEDSENKVQLVVNVLLLIIAAAGFIIAFLAKKDAANARKQGREELNALKTAVQKRTEGMEKAMQLMEQRLVSAEQAVRQISAEAQAASRQQPAATSSQSATRHRKMQPQRLYLTRPDEHGYFMAASERFERGNSIFELTTTDGVNGTFQVIDDDEVHQLALMMPTENITRACAGNNIQVSSGARRIVTDRSGTARKDNGRWRIVTMATIHYES